MDYSIPPTLGNINAALVGQNVTVGTLAIGGASLNGNALAVTGTANISSTITIGGAVNATSSVNSVDGRFSQSSGPIVDLRTANTVKFFRSDNVTLANVEGGSLALGGAALGGNVLAVTGTTLFTGNVDSTGYTNTSTAFQAAAGGSFYWNARSLMASPSDGVIKLSNNAQGDFNRLQFGGTTNLFPAIKRNATALHARLADDSNYADVVAARFSADSGVVFLGSNGALAAISDGVWLLKDNAGTSFTRLQFGGTGATYPAIARSGTTLKFRTADDLNDAPITAAAATFSGAVTVPGVTTAALTSTGTFTSGAAAQVGTLTNAPAAGNPTTWIKIIDGGVTRYIPAW